MPSFSTITDWFSDHQALVWWVSAGSIALLLLSPLVAIWFVTRLPKNYFVQKHRRALGSWEGYPTIRSILLVGKSILGAVLVLAGVIMLIAPGQGLLTIVVGLMLLEFPGKYRAERWLATRRSVWRSLNWLRKRAGQPELQSPRGTNSK
jgi:UPF0716 family protein affecting phage T7 exclusion